MPVLYRGHTVLKVVAVIAVNYVTYTHIFVRQPGCVIPELT